MTPEEWSARLEAAEALVTAPFVLALVAGAFLACLAIAIHRP